MGIIVCGLFSGRACAQDSFETFLRKSIDSITIAKGLPRAPTSQGLMPNDAVQSVMTPTGWGGNGAYIFGGVGGSYPAVYTKLPDLIESVGFCVGSSANAINFAASANITKATTLDDLTANYILSRRIGKASSIAIGGLQLLANSKISDSPGATFYFAFSHSFQWAHSKIPGFSSLSYTIGVGDGRFLLKSPDDIAAGKGKYGTGVFGNVSYELIKHVNLNAEWTGMNLGFSMGIHPFPSSAFSFGMGVSNLTSYSADKPSLVFSMGFPLSLSGRFERDKPSKIFNDKDFSF